MQPRRHFPTKQIKRHSILFRVFGALGAFSTMLAVSPTLAQESNSAFEPENVAEQKPSGVELKTPVPTLVASPGLCELQEGQTVCSMNTTLIWEVPRAGHYCLREAEQKLALRCWDNNWSGTLQVNFEAGNNQTYLLTRGENGTIAAKTTVTVTSTLVQRLRAKRRRSFWRIF
ncbi:DUF3019 domain-containing protein [Paraneptunicella aestuarii]|uniref:DUF3019 domain-containing protein n=1 Tax=Paraneptunicella aestuarii TaxID=2831148 RepID=UPI001E64A875|nr:DUF3019 domain-containing protein [Paraneptunicella aestuarii]UAA38417.1 DUF3019 domain-containing protein [Paraneptunicella aestuarii]